MQILQDALPKSRSRPTPACRPQPNSLQAFCALRPVEQIEVFGLPLLLDRISVRGLRLAGRKSRPILNDAGPLYKIVKENERGGYEIEAAIHSELNTQQGSGAGMVFGNVPGLTPDCAGYSPPSFLFKHLTPYTERCRLTFLCLISWS